MNSWPGFACCLAQTVVSALHASFPVAVWARGADEAFVDPRIRVQAYAPDVIYRLKGHVGYQIDLQFEPGESFVSLGAGDMESLTFAAQANHVFIKPRALSVETNITILTSLRTYQFDYVVDSAPPAPSLDDVTYAFRFTYPADKAKNQGTNLLERKLANFAENRAHNFDYGYCGSPTLKPESAWDDGVQTHLRFAARQELPAVFIRNDDGSESLINFSIESGEVVVQRIGRQFVVRRGRLQGCIVNRSFSGQADQLRSGTVAPGVERVTRSPPP